MLGRRPSGVVAGLSTKATLWALNGFEPPRQQPLAAVCPSLSKEGSNIFIECGSATRQQSLLNIPSSEAWRVSAEVRFPSPPTRLPRWREGAQLITQFLPGFALQHWNSLMPVNPPAPDVSVNTSAATASETIEARRGTDR